MTNRCPCAFVKQPKNVQLRGNAPYQRPGDLGVVKEGALADLILVSGNSLENLDLVADPDKNFVMIMKDGKIYNLDP